MPSHEQLQSVLFPRKFYTTQNAKAVIKANPRWKMLKTPRVTKDFIRFRQAAPNYKKYHYITKKIAHHIELIIGYPKNERR